MRVRAVIAGGAAAIALTAPPSASLSQDAGAAAESGSGAAEPFAPVDGAAAPSVRQMVVFRDGHALTKRVSTAATSVRIGRRRCAVGARTALAALVRSKVGRLEFHDFGTCSSRARDASGLFVRAIDGDRNRGQRGWVYKVGRRAATAGAGDLAGPFGSGRLRAGQRVTWFYCLRAGDCQRTLEVRARSVPGGVEATVRGYDDAGRGVAVEGATVAAGGVTGVTAGTGRVDLALAAGTYRIVARKDGLVRSFAERVEVP